MTFNYYAFLLVVSMIGVTVDIDAWAHLKIDANIHHPAPKSPNGAALDMHSDYDVSYYSGIPNISIPIFEAKSGGLKENTNLPRSG